jgi:hypothetical protein
MTAPSSSWSGPAGTSTTPTGRGGAGPPWATPTRRSARTWRESWSGAPSEPGRATRSVDPGRVRTPFPKALDAYLADLERLGRARAYRENQRRLLQALARDLGWSTLASVQAGPVTGWLRDFQARGRAPRTANLYLETAGAFLNWCVRAQYLEANPLARIGKADTTLKRRVRRALTDAELTALLGSAGPRRLVYLVAMYTGLRKGELASSAGGTWRWRASGRASPCGPR